MRLLATLLLASFSLLAGCAQFERNIEADEQAGSVQTLDRKQSESVDQLDNGGQINSYEAEQMQEAINGGE